MTLDRDRRVLLALVKARAALIEAKRGVADDAIDRRFHPNRTHKASSAESILRHCLRSRGWTARWKDDGLSGRERLTLLDSIRQYSRAWLHHEAEAFLRVYGSGDDGGQSRDIGRDGATSEGVARSTGSGSQEGDSGGMGCTGGITSATRGIAAAARHHVGRFFSRAKQFVRESILAGVMALSGPTPLSTADLIEADNQARVQYAYFDRFHAETLSQPPTPLQEPVPVGGTPEPGLVVIEPKPEPGATSGSQFAARVESYGGSAWIATQGVMRARVIAGGLATEERRLHSRLEKHAKCKTCIDATKAGWQNLGILPAIGDSECMSACDCYWEFRQGENGKVFSVFSGEAA